MRRWLPLALAVTVSSAAQAQPPTSPRLDFPLSMQGTLQSDDERSCSQSFATDSRRADIQLRIDRSGRATLTSDAHSRSRSGPSRGRFGAGDRTSSVLQSHDRVEPTGHARRDGAQLTITFDRSEHATARWQGEGVLPLGVSTSASATSVMRCSLTPTEVYPAQPAQAEQPTTMSVLACTLDPLPASLEGLSISTLRLLPGPGIVTWRDASAWRSSPTERVRQAR